MKIFTSINQFNRAYFPKTTTKIKEDLIIKDMSQKELIEYDANYAYTEHVQKIIKYSAYDGKVFNNKLECEIYEK